MPQFSKAKEGQSSSTVLPSLPHISVNSKNSHSLTTEVAKGQRKIRSIHKAAKKQPLNRAGSPDSQGAADSWIFKSPKIPADVKVRTYTPLLYIRLLKIESH